MDGRLAKGHGTQIQITTTPGAMKMAKTQAETQTEETIRGARKLKGFYFRSEIILLLDLNQF